MWGWTIKKAECQWIDAFVLWCWRRLLRVPWTARRSNQSILKETSTELEGLMLKLKRQYFGHLMWKTDSLEKTLMTEGMTEDEMVGDGRGGLACCNSWGRKESDMTEPLSWTENFMVKAFVDTEKLTSKTLSIYISLINIQAFSFQQWLH